MSGSEYRAKIFGPLPFIAVFIAVVDAVGSVCDLGGVSNLALSSVASTSQRHSHHSCFASSICGRIVSHRRRTPSSCSSYHRPDEKKLFRLSRIMDRLKQRAVRRRCLAVKICAGPCSSSWRLYSGNTAAVSTEAPGGQRVVQKNGFTDSNLTVGNGLVEMVKVQPSGGEDAENKRDGDRIGGIDSPLEIVNNRNKPRASDTRMPDASEGSTVAAAKLEAGVTVVPRHVAFVMDGNGRWASRRNMLRTAGHVEGARRAGEAVEACRALGVEFVTLYAFSTENWNRPTAEVSFLMELMEKTLLQKRDGLRRSGIRLTAIGELQRLPQRLRSLLQEMEEETARETYPIESPPSPSTTLPPLNGRGSAAEVTLYTRTASTADMREDACAGMPSESRAVGEQPLPQRMTLCLAISYGGRAEVAAAARELAAEAAEGKLDPADIDEKALGQRLTTARLGIPDPDLVVRTSGENRLSNLLLWQAAYSELYVIREAWPDFRRPELLEAFREFGRRRRRFGRTPEQAAKNRSN